MAMWDRLGQQLNTRGVMEQDLAQLEEQQLDDAYQELQQRQSARTRPSGLGLAFSSPGADDYFRRQGNDSDAAFLRSMLQTGERPRVRVGESEVEGAPWSGGGVQGGPFMAEDETPPRKNPYRVHKGRSQNDEVAIQELLMTQRLKQQGF